MHPSTKQTLIDYAKGATLSAGLTLSLFVLLASIAILLDSYGII